jgi:hypothetical protein
MPTPGAARCAALVPWFEKLASASSRSLAATQITFGAEVGGRWSSHGYASNSGPEPSRSFRALPAEKAKSTLGHARTASRTTVDMVLPPKLPFTTLAPFAHA